MFDSKDILARLQNGESPQKLADELAEALNSALNQYDEIQEQQREKRQKVADAQNTVNTLLDFVEAYYPDLYDEEFRTEFTGEVFVKAIDDTIAEVEKLKTSIKNLDQLMKDYEELRPKSVEKDPIKQFLAEFVDN